jgi:hypothetical protein
MESDGLLLTRSYATIARSLYPKAGVRWCSCMLLAPIRSGLGQCGVSVRSVGDGLSTIERLREFLDPKGWK